MYGPTRRRLLTSVPIASVLLPAGAGFGGADPDRGGDEAAQMKSREDESELDVTIVETTAPVSAGEYLEVTATVENTGTSDVRTDVELLVGDDRELVARMTTTIEAGETKRITHGYDTYPVSRDAECPVRMEAAGSADERTVSVSGASPLPDASPDERLTVQPGTELLFEAGAVDPNGSQTTHWWIDGQYAGGSFAVPWQAIYYAETGAHYWRTAFESPGTHDVAAAVVPDGSDDTYGAHWEVVVDEDGSTPPSIDGRRPEPGSAKLSLGDGGKTTIELDVTDPDGGLDRVVWWLTQSDTILGVSEVSGSSDTARLTVDADRLCHTCEIVPWVITADGTLAEPQETWQVERV
ncbi:hypothetical protein [Halosolutus gelatinilyticus]|uniref:hypothetical protein n=1 Tax=Halosolutus gelatinilyticus TaxID=2931975 RepID=UPI001FF4C4B0|nr:hypothetical protein [Halosolutus gelatinilyticus]